MLKSIENLHKKLVPLRKEKVKGVVISSKFLAGMASGGEFFDIKKEESVEEKLKNAQEKSIKEISEEISLLAEAAKSRKLKKTDIQGASFTKSSLGEI